MGACGPRPDGGRAGGETGLQRHQVPERVGVGGGQGGRGGDQVADVRLLFLARHAAPLEVSTRSLSPTCSVALSAAYTLALGCVAPFSIL